MKATSGFTIVETLIVITIIALLVTLGSLSLITIQKDARDNTRKGVALAISEALERYYEKNGEYPSVVSLVNNGGVTGQTVATKLGINVTDLKMPRLPSGATNPLTSTNPPTNDNITYIGQDDVNNTQCQTTATGGCDQFSIRYISESTGDTIITESRRRDRGV